MVPDAPGVGAVSPVGGPDPRGLSWLMRREHSSMPEELYPFYQDRKVRSSRSIGVVQYGVHGVDAEAGTDPSSEAAVASRPRLLQTARSRDRHRRRRRRPVRDRHVLAGRSGAGVVAVVDGAVPVAFGGGRAGVFCPPRPGHGQGTRHAHPGAVPAVGTDRRGVVGGIGQHVEHRRGPRVDGCRPSPAGADPHRCRSGGFRRGDGRNRGGGAVPSVFAGAAMVCPVAGRIRAGAWPWWTWSGAPWPPGRSCHGSASMRPP